MAKIDRYDGNLKAFASEQLTNERTLFGQVAIANDLTSQITAQFLRGWGIVGPSDQPSLQDFNAAMYTNGQLLAYLHQMGVAEYNAAQEYFISSVTQTAGVLYMSLTDANIGNDPSSSPVNWKAFTADQATEIALGLVKIATQALTNAGADDVSAVTPKKLAVTTQGQKHTAFSTTGTATAQVLAPVPAITAYAALQRFNVTFNIASGVNPTINVSGRGVKFLKQYDSSGTKIAAVFAGNQNSDIVYDGTDWILLDQLPVSAVQVKQGRRGSALNWKASATGASAIIVCTADQIVVADNSGNAILVSPVINNINTAAAAAAALSGMASGPTVANTTYNIFVWHNPTSGVTVATGDISATAPTPPAAGYTHWARRGTFRTDATANKFPLSFIALGDKTQLDPGTGKNITDLVQLATAGGTIGVTSVPINNIVPLTAISIDLVLGGNATGASLAAAAMPRASSANLQMGIVLPSGAAGSSKGSFLLAESVIYWLTAFTGGGSIRLYCAGWEDAL